MKTRIISATVMIALVIAVLTVGKLYYPFIITLFIAAICAIGVYELLHNAAKVNSKVLSIIASFYGASMVILLSISTVSKDMIMAYSIEYFVFAVIAVLYKHKDFSLDKIMAFTAYPFFLSYGFYMLNSLIVDNKGIYYLLLLVNFASICDTGAYFVGSFIGKNKLCPEISPKKTVEGAVGGIVSSIIVSLVLVLVFNSTHLSATLLLTIPLCILGMLGDLFASAIKRSVGLKDYGNLIPGHGGILDRFDSMLLITPVLYMLINFGVI